MARGLFFLAGWLLVALGFVGAFLPLLPTTPFLILAVGCFARSSPRLETWLLTHPRFGPALVQWHERGAIPVKGKILSFVGIVTGFALFWISSHPSPSVALAVAGFMACGVIYVMSRPS